jgi:hypothetical protein
LAQQSQICVVARDRGRGYGAAAQRAPPHAIQVADRWHLMENASGASQQGIAIKEIVRRTGYSRGLIRKILRGQRSDVFRVRQGSLEPYLPGSTSNGTPAAEMDRPHGGNSGCADSEAAFAS